MLRLFTRLIVAAFTLIVERALRSERFMKLWENWCPLSRPPKI